MLLFYLLLTINTQRKINLKLKYHNEYLEGFTTAYCYLFAGLYNVCGFYDCCGKIDSSGRRIAC